VGTFSFGLAYAQTAEAVSLIQQVNKLYGEKLYSEAVPLAQRLLAVREAELGPYDPGVATCLDILANLYQVQDRYADAEPLFKRSWRYAKKPLCIATLGLVQKS
jgi:hypothetical protein